VRLDRRFSTESGVWSRRLARGAITPGILYGKGRFYEPKPQSGQNAPVTGPDSAGEALVSTRHSPTIPIAPYTGLQLAAHDVRVGAVVVDEVAARIGNVGQETGDEVEGIDGVGLLAVVAGRGQVRGSGRAWRPPQAGEADGVAQAVASEGLEGAAVAGWDGHEVVDREAGVVPAPMKASPAA
jgi:hypothetical protein